MPADDPMNKYGKLVPYRMKGVHYSHTMPTDDCVPKKISTCVKPSGLPWEMITDKCVGIEPPFTREFRPRRIRVQEVLDRLPRNLLEGLEKIPERPGFDIEDRNQTLEHAQELMAQNEPIFAAWEKHDGCDSNQ